MLPEMERIFRVKTCSTRQLLSENGQGWYIPAYWQSYSWENEKISRLFESVLNGLIQLKDRPNTISFLGTVISIDDAHYRTVKPLFRPDVPRRVMTIIDGQQRICTLIMFNIALHNHIRTTSSRFNGKTDDHFSWIHDQSIEMLADLRMTYLIDMITGRGNYRFFPRAIRAYSDAWSRRDHQARYESDIAKLVWDFIHLDESRSERYFEFKPVQSSGSTPDRYQKIQRAFAFIQSELQRVCESKSGEFCVIHPITATQEADVAKAIWGFEPPDEVKKYVAEPSQDADYTSFCCLLRYLIFARYLNHRVAIMNVLTKNEDDAFAMFESLNADGTPLTAVDTLKPKVLGLEALGLHRTSDRSTYLTEIERYLNKERSANESQRAASEMLIAFALAETGHKLPERLNYQRHYLKDQFENLARSDDRKRSSQFLQSLATIASFMENGWNVDHGDQPKFNPLTVTDEDALVGFEALKKLGCSITIAALFRFFQTALDTDPETFERSLRKENFVSAIKATAAFSFLWRGAIGNTTSIDSHYREIMHSGISFNGQNIPPLSRRPNGGQTGVVSIMNYKRSLRYLLQKGGIECKNQWLSRISMASVSQSTNVVARFLLFCANDDSVPDSTRPGVIEKGQKGCSPMLTLDRWNDEKYFSIEHIAPHSRSNGWESDIYNDHRNIHLLGNLILLPKDVNNIIANRSWQHKRLMYRLLAAETQLEFDEISLELGKEGLVLGNTAANVLANSKYLGICKSVGIVEGTWSLKIIEERTRCLAGLAWDRLAPWLFS